MGDIKVSVIIPVWNPGPGIVRCIDTLRNQTLREIEMIFVDDLGTDESMDKVRNTANEDSRIRILTNPENLGPGHSRNRGIEEAKGEYLSFVDPDDYVAEDFLELLYNKGHNEGLDIVKGRTCYISETGERIKRDFELNEKIQSGLRMNKPLYTLFTYQHQSALYRRENIINNSIYYGDYRKAQDTTFLVRACLKSKNLEIVNDAIYYFVERHNSAMHTFNEGILMGQLGSVSEQIKSLESGTEKDEYLILHICNKINECIRLIGRYENCAGEKEVVSRCGENLKKVISDSLYAEDYINNSVIIKVFMEYNSLVYFEYHILPWEKPTEDEVIEPVTRWVDFLRDHPECDKSYNWALNKAFSIALSKDKNNEVIKKRVSQERERLPLKWKKEVRIDQFKPRFMDKLKSWMEKILPSKLYNKIYLWYKELHKI